MHLPNVFTKYNHSYRQVDKSLQYYAENHMCMNFDGRFRLRVLEGSYVPIYVS